MGVTVVRVWMTENRGGGEICVFPEVLFIADSSDSVKSC